MKYFFLALCFIITSEFFAQSKNPDDIMNSVKREYSKVKDYTVDMTIKLNIPGVKAPDSKTKLYWKAPNKVHFESNQFALLPKEGIDFNPVKFVSENHSAVYIKDEIINGVKTSNVKVLFNDPNSKVLLANLWINMSNYSIVRAEITSKNNGTFNIEFNYDKAIQYNLPTSTTFSFTMDKLNLPKTFNGNSSSNQDKKENKVKEGKVFIEYKNYQINKGIDDKIFK